MKQVSFPLTRLVGVAFLALAWTLGLQTSFDTCVAACDLFYAQHLKNR